MKRVFPAFAAVAALLSPATAAAGPAGFSDPVAVGSGGPAQTAAAINSSGRAVLLWTSYGQRAIQVQVAWREGRGLPWKQQLAVTGAQIREPQAVVTPSGQILVAWAQIATSGAQHIVVGSVLPGGPFRVTRRFSVPSASAPAPRLAVLRSGSVLLAYRWYGQRGASSQVRTAVQPAGSERFRAPKIVGRHVASVGLAADASGAVVVWPTPAQRGRRERTLYGQRLRSDGSATGSRFVVSRRAGGEVRLTGAPGDRAIASWVRPALGVERPPAYYTRALTPYTRPARLLTPPNGRAGLRSPAAVALRDRDGLVAAVAFGENPFGFSVFSATALFGGEWFHRETRTSAPNAMVGDPRPLLLEGGEGLVVWSQVGSATSNGSPVYDVVVSRRASTSAPFESPQRIGGDLTTSDGRGVVAVTAGKRVLVAWPRAEGGMFVAERG